MSEKIIRWGLMGAGAILDRFMLGVMNVDNMEVVAIASRTPESAKRQAEKYNIPEINTYEELVNRDDIDIVYINSIHPAHCDMAIMAMNAKKAVLVEKPAAVNAADFAKMAECAKKNNVFMMEAVWTRFFPIWDKVREVIESGKIGKICMIESAFCFALDKESASSRLLDVNQAGGSLLDVGVYNLNFANIITGKYPKDLSGHAAINTDDNNYGIDEAAAFVLHYDTGELAICKCAVRCNMAETAYIYGTKGNMVIPHFYKPEKVAVSAGREIKLIEDKVPQRVEGIEDEGYQFEIMHVNDCLRKGLKESPVVPHSHTMEILRECDNLRSKWGIKYPFED